MTNEQVTFAFTTKNKYVQNDADEKRSDHKRKRLLGIPTNRHFIFSLKYESNNKMESQCEKIF